jgi:hypothetical protein
MSQTNDGKGTKQELDDQAEREAIAEVDEKLDEQSDGEGLGAEAGRGEEYGLSEG